MTQNNDDNFWLAKIADSKYLTSDNDIKLLRFLIIATREGRNLKETVIAIDVFGRDSNFDPGSDSIVRTNIYNLRKKLRLYYLDEGANDRIRFTIPKGHYRVIFETIGEVESEQNLQSPKTHKIIVYFGFTIPVLFLLLLVFIYFNKTKTDEVLYTKNTDPIWGYYKESENPLLIVLGDYFMMEKIQIPDSSFSYIRIPEINNQNDFSVYLNNNPNKKETLKKLGQSYFGEEIPNCFLQLLTIFKHTKKDINMKYASNLNLNDVRENDIIFIGDFGTKGILEPFFLNSGFRYSISPPAIYVLDDKHDTIENITLNNPNQSLFQIDYATVSNVYSYENRQILFILSFLPFGKSEALYKLQDESFLAEHSQSGINTNAEWRMLMKISGLQSSGFYYEILELD